MGFGLGLRRARRQHCRLYTWANSAGHEARGKELPAAAAHAPRYLECAHGMLLAHLTLRGRGLPTLQRGVQVPEQRDLGPRDESLVLVLLDHGLRDESEELAFEEALEQPLEPGHRAEEDAPSLRERLLGDRFDPDGSSVVISGTQRHSAATTHLLGDRFDPDGRARESEHLHREVRAVPLGGDAQLRVHLAVVEHDGHVGEATQLEQQRV